MECLGAWAWSRHDRAWRALAYHVERRGDTMTVLSVGAPAGDTLLIQAIVPAPKVEPAPTTDSQMPRAYGPARRKKW